MKTALVVAAVAVAVVAVAAVAGTRGPGNAAEARAADAPWTFAAPMSQRRSYIAAAELDRKIYAAGGMVGETGRFLSVFQRFDPAANDWVTLTPLPDPTRAAAGAALDGVVYVFGGQTDAGVTDRVLAYDIAKGEWEDRAPLPRPLFNEAAVAMDGKIYVLGGFSGGKELRSVYVYDPPSDSWSVSAPMPIPNHTFGAVDFQGGIWTFGGRRGEETLRDVFIFDPQAEKWRAGPTMPKPMELNGTAVWGPEIHTIWEHTYQIYDARTGEWSQGPEPLVPRHGLKAFAIDGTLYAVGGCTTELHDSQVVEARNIAIR
ncbi:MAG TPA: kelch repeat-containing protein [Gaiellaceae bacterium]|jgi:N-acetylneuraminic acid mutarotase|nr:kelch repeat-containing protein [Gaiellaceae bacterium]